MIFGILWTKSPVCFRTKLVSKNKIVQEQKEIETGRQADLELRMKHKGVAEILEGLKDSFRKLITSNDF